MRRSRRITQAGPGPGKQVVSRRRQAADIGSARRSRRTRGRARGSKKSNATGKPERWERRVESKQAWARNEWQPWRVSGVVSRSPFCGDKGSAGGVVQEGCARAVLGVLSAPAQGVRSAEGMWPGKWATTVDGDGGGTAQRRESCEQGAAATETERRGRRGGRQREVKARCGPAAVRRDGTGREATGLCRLQDKRRAACLPGEQRPGQQRNERRRAALPKHS